MAIPYNANAELAADNVLRLLPALNIPDADLAEAVARLDRAAASLEKAAVA